MKDLVCLVPDRNVEYGLRGLLERNISLGIREITYDIYVHPKRDPGILNGASDFLQEFSSIYSCGIVFIDYEGCGRENEKNPEDISIEIKNSLSQKWGHRIEVIVFRPKLEIWLWVDSPHTANELGWDNYPNLKDFLIQRGLWISGKLKPDRPKEAVEAALWKRKIPRSSSIYYNIAKKVSLERCTDASFHNFKSLLKRWFSKGRRS